MEWNALVHGLIRSYLGLGVGGVVALMFGYWAYDLICLGHDVAGSLLGTVDIVALVSVFVVGKRTFDEDLARKRAEVEKLKGEEQQPPQNRQGRPKR